MEILTTIARRPYVVCFLIVFLILSARHVGIKRSILWLVLGYILAFASEYSSIHNGFPYGKYQYIYENLKGELIFMGVPVWDSLSYVFMTYASYAAASYLLPAEKRYSRWFLASILTLLLDIITDPIANLGERWFLGKIYYYESPGLYFGIPISNFAGWWLVSFIIIGINTLFGLGEARRPNIIYLLFYISISAFNILVGAVISAYSITLINIGIMLGVIIFFALLKRRCC